MSHYSYSNLNSTDNSRNSSKNCIQENSFINSYKEHFESEINNLFNYFIRAFELNQFYNEDQNFNDKNNKTEIERPSRINAIKLFNEFLTRNKISYSDNYNLISNQLHQQINSTIKTQFILQNFKTWIMYIIIMSKTLNFSETLKIFEMAINNQVDSIQLFEFFLIFISNYDNTIFIKNINTKWPEEFIKIYFKNKKNLNEIFNIKNNIYKNVNNDHSIYSFDEFSFYNSEIDLQNEEKLKSLIEEIEDDEDKIMNEILMDDLIQDTQMVQKSPTGINKSNNLNNSHSPLFFNKSPTLDNYLLENCDDGNDDYEKDENMNFNLEIALQHIEVTNNNNCNEDYNIQEDYIQEDYIQEDYIQEDDNITYNIEDFYNEDNLLLIDKNYKNKNNFAIFILTNKLKEIYQEKNSINLLYMITPLQKFKDSLYNNIQIQKDLDEIRKSAYVNFVYFPLNEKLIKFLDDE